MRKYLVICTMWTWAAACGGSSGTGIDSQKPLSELTPTETMKLCQVVVSEILEPARRLGCYASAYGEATCVADAQMCLDELKADAEGACDQAGQAMGCAAQLRAGQVEQCARALGDWLGPYADKASCEKVEIPSDPPDMDACSAVLEQCPDWAV